MCLFWVRLVKTGISFPWRVFCICLLYKEDCEDLGKDCPGRQRRHAFLNNDMKDGPYPRPRIRTCGLLLVAVSIPFVSTWSYGLIPATYFSWNISSVHSVLGLTHAVISKILCPPFSFNFSHCWSPVKFQMKPHVSCKLFSLPQSQICTLLV